MTVHRGRDEHRTGRPAKRRRSTVRQAPTEDGRPVSGTIRYGDHSSRRPRRGLKLREHRPSNQDATGTPPHHCGRSDPACGRKRAIIRRGVRRRPSCRPPGGPQRQPVQGPLVRIYPASKTPLGGLRLTPLWMDKIAAVSRARVSTRETKSNGGGTGRGNNVMVHPRRGLKSAVNRDRLGGGDRAPADLACRAAAADRDCSDLGEHPIEARQSAGKPPAAKKKQAEITKKSPVFPQAVGGDAHQVLREEREPAPAITRHENGAGPRPASRGTRQPTPIPTRQLGENQQRCPRLAHGENRTPADDPGGACHRPPLSVNPLPHSKRATVRDCCPRRINPAREGPGRQGGDFGRRVLITPSGGLRFTP